MKSIILSVLSILGFVGIAVISRAIGYEYGLIGAGVLVFALYLISTSIKVDKQVNKPFLGKPQELIIYLLMITCSYVLHTAQGESAGSTIFGIVGAVGLFALATRAFISSIRHNERLVKLEGKSSWRFAKAVYLGVSLLLLVFGILAALADTYHEHQTGYIAWLGLLLGLLYPIYWRVAYYVTFGKSRRSNK